MEERENREGHWICCPGCQGRGKRSRRLSGKARRRYQNALSAYKKSGSRGKAPERPEGHPEDCLACRGTGLERAMLPPEIDHENYPRLAIIGGGIGGVALAVACRHRGIPFTLYERDETFSERSQGYGLTLQQASKAIGGLGLSFPEGGIISTRHLVHDVSGKVVGEWGVRKLPKASLARAPKRTNIHLARQALRSALLDQLEGFEAMKWGHQLLDFQEGDDLTLRFLVKGEETFEKADLIVGADGIRSTVRKLLIGEKATPLSYLGCLVILGICPLESLGGLEHPLLDSATVFQTANGHERIYLMPYDADSVMWQLSFPMAEGEARALSALGKEALKEEAIRRCPWHDPIPQILRATRASEVSGYPVYDRALLTPELLRESSRGTLIGDAAHPMSPFKGQGANQALLDALALARGIRMSCRPASHWREKGLRETFLNDFEKAMIERSSPKVKESAEAAEFLHSDIVLREGDEPRGRSRNERPGG